MAPLVSNVILYCVQFEKKLTSQVAASLAKRFVNDPIGNFTPYEQYTKLAEEVAYGTDLTRLIPEVHTEETFRKFLAMMIKEMDNLRPWPERLLYPLDIPQWDHFKEARLVARIFLSSLKLEPRIKEIFQRPDNEDKRVCLLHMKSGTDIALVDDWWPGSNDVALLVRDPEASAEAAITEFLSGASLEPEQVSLLTDD